MEHRQDEHRKVGRHSRCRQPRGGGHVGQHYAPLDTGHHSLVDRACGGRRFAIPQTSISELVLVKAGERTERLQYVKNAEVLRLRGNLLPLARLSTALSLQTFVRPADSEQTGVAGNTNIIVLESGHLRYRADRRRLARFRRNRGQTVGQAHEGLPVLRGGHHPRRRPGGLDPGRLRACLAGVADGPRCRRTVRARRVGSRRRRQQPDDALVHQRRDGAICRSDGTDFTSGTNTQRPDRQRGRARRSPIPRGFPSRF